MSLRLTKAVYMREDIEAKRNGQVGSAGNSLKRSGRPIESCKECCESTFPFLMLA